MFAGGPGTLALKADPRIVRQVCGPGRNKRRGPVGAPAPEWQGFVSAGDFPSLQRCSESILGGKMKSYARRHEPLPEKLQSDTMKQ